MSGGGRVALWHHVFFYPRSPLLPPPSSPEVQFSVHAGSQWIHHHRRKFTFKPKHVFTIRAANIALFTQNLALFLRHNAQGWLYTYLLSLWVMKEKIFVQLTNLRSNLAPLSVFQRRMWLLSQKTCTKFSRQWGNRRYTANVCWLGHIFSIKTPFNHIVLSEEAAELWNSGIWKAALRSWQNSSLILLFTLMHWVRTPPHRSSECICPLIKNN